MPSIKQLLALKEERTIKQFVAVLKEKKKSIGIGNPLPSLAWISNPCAISILWAESLSY
jgi:hypothetical protein